MDKKSAINVASPKNASVQLIIENYKKHIAQTHLKDEVYKWELVEKHKGKPNLETDDLHEEIKSIDYSNLIYHLSAPVILKNLI